MTDFNRVMRMSAVLEKYRRAMDAARAAIRDNLRMCAYRNDPALLAALEDIDAALIPGTYEPATKPATNKESHGL